MLKFIRNNLSTALIAIMFCFLTPSLANAKDDETNEFTIEYASLEVIDSSYHLDADILYSLNEEVTEALDHGIPLQIDIEIIISQPRQWLWDKTIRKVLLRKKLEHHPLSNQYLITDLDSGIKRHFLNLPSGLKYLGEIKSRTLFPVSLLNGDKPYTAKVRTRLNSESLPTPLRLSTYISSDWQLISPWYRWEVTR